MQPPDMIGCEEWGARPVHTVFPRRGAAGIVIHNTDSPNREPREGDAERAAAAALARGIQADHMDRNGWKDTGQHFTISRGGLVLEGRHGSWDGAKQGEVVRGAHAGDDTANATMFGIENEGRNVNVYSETEHQWDVLVKLCAWLAYWGDFDTANIWPHRHFVATDCPGHLADRIDDLRQQAHDAKVEIIGASGPRS